MLIKQRIIVIPCQGFFTWKSNKFTSLHKRMPPNLRLKIHLCIYTSFKVSKFPMNYLRKINFEIIHNLLLAENLSTEVITIQLDIQTYVVYFNQIFENFRRFQCFLIYMHKFLYFLFSICVSMRMITQTELSKYK